MLTVTNLSCVRQQQTIFSHLNFNLQPGELLIIEGENGSGKSSLIRLLSGIATPSSGHVHYNNENIQSSSDYFSNLHYVTHANGIKLGLTVYENLQLLARLAEKNMDWTLMQAELDALQLASVLNKQAVYLSAGQKRRIALCKLFLFHKKIWVLDEPLTALDTKTQAYFYQKLTAHLQQNNLAIISSHHEVLLPNQRIKRLRLEKC